MSYKKVAIRFHSLSLGDTIICVLHCPEHKISEELDQKIASYVQKQKYQDIFLENIPLEVLASETPMSGSNASILYVLENTFTLPEISPDHITLLLIPKKDIPSYEEDIVSLVLKKFMIVVLFVILFSWLLSKLPIEIAAEL